MGSGSSAGKILPGFQKAEETEVLPREYAGCFDSKNVLPIKQLMAQEIAVYDSYMVQDRIDKDLALKHNRREQGEISHKSTSSVLLMSAFEKSNIQNAFKKPKPTRLLEPQDIENGLLKYNPPKVITREMDDDDIIRAFVGRRAFGVSIQFNDEEENEDEVE